MSYFFTHCSDILYHSIFMWSQLKLTSAISPREERKENEICGIGYINFVLSWSFKKLNNKERSLEKISLFNLFEEWKLKLLFNILICFRVIFTQLPFLGIFFVNLWFDLEYNLDLFIFYPNLVKKALILMYCISRHFCVELLEVFKIL